MKHVTGLVGISKVFLLAEFILVSAFVFVHVIFDKTERIFTPEHSSPSSTRE